MPLSDKQIIKGVLAFDQRAVARLISLCENRCPRARSIQAELFPHTGKASVIGITGSPGAGKSTLVDQLALYWQKQGMRVGVIAIDPTSPFTGGALLGDRIRMNRAAQNQAVFIRSMATRGALGGISRATLDAVQVLDAAGCQIILLETVGVGQVEVDVARTADSCIVVLVPGMGDAVQSLKAGILEIADLFVINKADRDGADALERDLRVLLSLDSDMAPGWFTPIIRTVATMGEGLDELCPAILKHGQWLLDSADGASRRRLRVRENLLRLAADLAFEKLLCDKREQFESLIEDCLQRKCDYYSAALTLMS